LSAGLLEVRGGMWGRAALWGAFVAVVAVALLLRFRPSAVFHMGIPPGEAVEGREVVKLPPPKTKGVMSVEEAIARRRSRRDFLEEPLPLPALSQILWAAQGITEPRRGLRAAPSAGATYPLEIYAVVGRVEGLEPGVYRYIPQIHALEMLLAGDLRKDLARACLYQMWVAKAPFSLVIAAVYERTTGRYGERGVRYVHMEVGHVGQNIYLQAEALGLGTCAVGAFLDSEVGRLLRLPPDQSPLYVMPVGRPAT